MRFVLDTTVEKFLFLHARACGKNAPIQEVLTLTNDMTPEPVTPGQNLNLLSSGQARALMIRVSDMPMGAFQMVRRREQLCRRRSVFPRLHRKTALQSMCCKKLLTKQKGYGIFITTF